MDSPTAAGGVPTTTTTAAAADGGVPERRGRRSTPGADGPVPAGRTPDRLAERCGWSLAWLAVLIGGIDLWGAWTSWSWAGVVAPLLVVAGIAGIGASWWVRNPSAPALQIAALGSACVSVLANAGAGIHLRQFYTTDSAAFGEAAARLVQRGANPYTSSLAWAERFLQNPAAYWTYTASGGHVTRASYPAGSFLIEVPLLLVGFRHAIVDWTDLVAWVVTGVLLFVMVPVAVRWFALLVFTVPIFAAIFGAGGTDAAFLPFLVLAVWRWDRFGTGRGAGLAGWMGPVALGLACSIKQTPWFCLPFLALGLFLEARATGRRPVPLVARYVAVVAGVFVLVNLPYIVWQPSAWLRGTLLPLTQPLVADGQGLITLATHGIARGVSFPLLTAAGLLVLASLLSAMVVWYPVMKRGWMLLLPLAFFVAPRSLSTYLIDLFPAAVVAALTVRPAAGQDDAVEPDGVVAPASGPARSGAGRRALGTAVPVLLMAAAVVVAVVAFTSAPLTLVVRSVVASNAATSFDAVTLSVHNTTGGTVTPHFMVSVGVGHPAGFWSPAGRRPVVIGPYATTSVTLRPARPTAAPTHGTHWLVEAYTTSPEALSTSPLLFWKLGKPATQAP